MTDKTINIAGVSIHAPVMGANQYTDDIKQELSVSIHAPVMGANNYGYVMWCAHQFQSTHP